MQQLVNSLRGVADLFEHVTVDVIQPPQLLALGGHELAPVMCRLAVQTPPALKKCELNNRLPIIGFVHLPIWCLTLNQCMTMQWVPSDNIYDRTAIRQQQEGSMLNDTAIASQSEVAGAAMECIKILQCNASRYCKRQKQQKGVTHSLQLP